MNKQVENKLGHAKREIAALNKKLKALQAECEKLRKDAERYRWIRDGDDEAKFIAVNFYGDEWDVAIDAAMQETGHDNQ